MPCNGMEIKQPMGNLNTQTFQDIWMSNQAKKIREMVSCCDRGCWMIGSAVPAMRKNIFIPITWVLKNKIRLMQGNELEFK